MLHGSDTSELLDSLTSGAFDSLSPLSESAGLSNRQDGEHHGKD